MKAKVIQKSPYGFRVEGREGWINYGQYYEGTKDFGVNDEVELETKGNFLTTLKVLVVNSPQKNGHTNGHISVTAAKNDPTVRAEIARGTAIKAVFGSAALATQLQNVDISQATSILEGLVLRSTNYVLTGKFLDTEVAQKEKN